MDKNQNKNHRLELILALFVLLCTVLILVELYTNVTNELQGSFFTLRSLV